MKRLFFICLFVTLVGLAWANNTYAVETEIQAETKEETPENSVVIFSEPEESVIEIVKESSELSSEQVIEEIPESIDEPVTIQQMKDNLEELKTEKQEIWNKWTELSQVNGKILDFLKDDLSNEDIQVIQALSLDFQQRQAFYELQLKNNAEENFDTSVAADNDTAAVKDNFIQYKLTFYKKLVPYVNIALKDQYLEYIRFNIAIEQEEKTIKEKIYKQEEGIEERVETIKEKIKEHKEDLEEKLEILIRDKIQEKIENILTKPEIINLSNPVKIQILKAVEVKLVQKKEEFISNNADTEYARKKIAIYVIVIEVLNEKIQNLQQ